MGRTRWVERVGALVAASTVAVTVGSTVPAHASLAHPAVVSENPSDTTPHIVLSDTSFDVRAFAQVGRTVYAGGLFNQVQDWAKTTTYARQNFVAFDSETGVISPLDLAFDGTVGAIVATDDGSALFIGGAFSRVNGIVRRGILKYDLVNNRVDPTFAPTGMRTVHDIKLLANGSVIAAGNFTKKLMALNPTTGADTGAINITVTGVVNPDDETRVRHIAISPNGTRLVATGNFTAVNGQTRRRAFMLNLGSTATLSTWYSPRFDVNCPAGGSRREWAQGVDFSPDGSYFVIVTTGGPNGTVGLCDAAARFNTGNVASTAQPTWINFTGGDTLYSVAATGPAVYVGGHQRWLNNPQGHDSAGPGAVERPGIGAIDPVTGLALPWNPTKSREHGTMVLFATPAGLWVGSDGANFGHEEHAGIGFAPLNRVGCPASPSFDYTIPTPVGPPAATSLPDGRIAYSALGADGQYYLAATDLTNDPPAVGPLECLGGTATDRPAVAAGSSFVALFARTADNRIWQRTLTASGSGSWSPIPIGGGSSNGPSAVVVSGDVVHVVVRGTNGAVYHATRRGSTWSPWQNLGGAILGSPAVAPRPGGGIAIFARGTDNGILAKYGDTGSWSGWSRFAGGTLSSPTVAWGYRTGRLDVFVAGTSGGLYQNALVNGTWTNWIRLDTTLPASARLAAAARYGRVIVYASTGTGTSYKQFLGRWVGYFPAPYTCASCLPRARSTSTVG